MDSKIYEIYIFQEFDEFLWKQRFLYWKSLEVHFVIQNWLVGLII